MVERIFRVWHTVLEMLSDRGYIVAPALLELDLDDFLIQYGVEDMDATDMCALRKKMTAQMRHGGEDRNRQIRVLFLDREELGLGESGKIGKPMIPNLVERIGHGDTVQALLILSDEINMTPPARKVLEAMCEEHPGILQWFHEEELVVNFVRDDAKRGMRYSHMSSGSVKGAESMLRSLSRIYSVDRVARYFNAQANDMICLERRSETSAVAKIYHRCVSAVHRDDVKDF